jgi:hypothetical protein
MESKSVTIWYSWDQPTKLVALSTNLRNLEMHSDNGAILTHQYDVTTIAYDLGDTRLQVGLHIRVVGPSVLLRHEHCNILAHKLVR